MSENNLTPAPSFWARHGYLFKAAIILILVLVMQIPTAMVASLIHEREQRQRQATTEVSSKYGGQQTILGPVLTVPYYVTAIENEKPVKNLAYAHLLPSDLNIGGTAVPEKLKRGIYEIAVYQSKIKFAGQFDLSNFANLNIPANDVLWQNAALNIGISDLRGIEEQIKLTWEKSETFFNSGVISDDITRAGVHALVPVSTQGIYNFAFSLDLKGSFLLHFTPVGRESKIDFQSSWRDPSFRGAFLPDKRSVTDKGFTANWKILHLNRPYPQQWKGSTYTAALNASAFGVDLLLPKDHYDKSQRTVKYSFLLISLAFMVFFFVEVLNRKRVHPFQYILVGLAMTIFFSLMIAFAEYINFDISYWIAVAMTVGLIGLYTRAIFQDKQYSLLIAGILGFLYMFIFVVVRMQDYSLLIGSIGLFLALATVMYLSRKLNWYNLSAETVD